jgi:hypothetical protein
LPAVNIFVFFGGKSTLTCCCRSFLTACAIKWLLRCIAVFIGRWKHLALLLLLLLLCLWNRTIWHRLLSDTCNMPCFK